MRRDNTGGQENGSRTGWKVDAAEVFRVWHTQDLRKGGLHESEDCTALVNCEAVVILTARGAFELMAESKRKDGRNMVYLCARCRGMR